jgi:cytoskeletal protein CcmA (bactofilin family)
MAYASVIGNSAVIRGNVRGETSLEILGRIEGDVGISGDLSLGRDAVVIGTLAGARIIIAGSVEGDVTATEAVLISDTGRVIGDLKAPRIGMSEGAHVQGSVRTEGSRSEASRSEASRSESSSGRSSAARERAQEPRPAPAAPIERSAPRPAAPVVQQAASPAPKPLAKKEPPPPVIHAPRPGARAKKKVARR